MATNPLPVSGCRQMLVTYRRSWPEWLMPDGRVHNVCFHGVGTPHRTLEPGEERYWVTRTQFIDILDEISQWPATRISFDDGNASDVEIALPALVERGLRADFFVLAGRLDAPGSLRRADLRELRRHGMTVGSHGMAHRPWRGMDRHTSHEELVTAREHIAQAYGAEVTTAACPLGRYDRRLLSDLRKLGYCRVYTSDRRVARTRAWLQPRFSVRSDDSPASLRRTVLDKPSVGQAVRLGTVGVLKRLR